MLLFLHPPLIFFGVLLWLSVCLEKKTDLSFGLVSVL